uniref:Uncharacterized protein n=1 Tax=uncultured euryarchaeote Alv-FOS5 TaxID=337891 RepID=Q3SB95_9EURY|nr:hypothetical protein [uncultured euryarchaeote Alv-FOS5]
MARTLGVDSKRLENLLSEVDPNFWENIEVKEVSMSDLAAARGLIEKHGTLRIVDEQGNVLETEDAKSSKKYLIEDSKIKQLPPDKRELLEKEKLASFMDVLSHYSFEYHDMKEAKSGQKKEDIRKDVEDDIKWGLEEKAYAKRNIFHKTGGHSEVNPLETDKFFVFVHKDLGPIGFVSSGYLVGNVRKRAVPRLIAHPVVTDKDFEFRLKDSKWFDLPKDANPDELKARLVKSLKNWEKEHEGQKNKLSVGTILLLKAMVDLPKFHIDANHRTQGVMRKIEERLGRKFFFDKGQVDREYKRFMFSRARSRVKRPK